MACSVISKDMLVNPICVNQEDILDFQTARLIADQKARELAGDPMLLAWYEARSGKFSRCSRKGGVWML